MSDVLSAADAREEEKAVMAALDNAYQGFNAPGTLEGARDSLLALARSHEQLRAERDAAAGREQQYHNLWHDETDRAEAAEAAARAGGCAADALRQIVEHIEENHEHLTMGAVTKNPLAEQSLAWIYYRAVSGQTAEKEEA